MTISKNTSGLRCDDGTAVILAGGGSERMGTDKRYARFDGQALLARAIGTVAKVFPKVCVVADRDSLPEIPSGIDVDVIIDEYRANGPLGGIHAALSSCTTPYAFVAACDMPFLNVSLIRYLFGLAAGYQAVVPRVLENLEPLHAVYAIECAGPIEGLLRTEQRRLRGLFDMIEVRYVDEEEVRRFDPELLSFFNINTPDDLAEAEIQAARRSN